MSGMFPWVIGIFLIVLSGSLGYREYIKYQLKQLEMEKFSSTSMKKKVLFIRRREQEKHVYSLLNWGVGITIILFYLFYFLLMLQQKNVALTHQLIQVTEEVRTLKTEQKQFIQQFPLSKYPDKGIEIPMEEWEAMATEKDTREIQGKLEQYLAHSLAPYLGLSTVIITVDSSTKQSKLSIQIEERKGLDMKETTKKIVKDFSKINGLMTIKFQTVSSIDGASQQKNNWIYSRKEGEDFSLLTDKT
ncbi:hypothetical protein IGI37_000613 [Enterococcus sp. AZ194]|uniref:hypothetical protein n=1 Tax=Enterococcus sp. AZ194 TaxID=2774629 RepID=UPI003F222185